MLCLVSNALPDLELLSLFSGKRLGQLHIATKKTGKKAREQGRAKAGKKAGKKTSGSLIYIVS